MMISPEYYVETEISGKTLEQAAQKIAELKNETEALKNEIALGKSSGIQPSEAVMLSVTRDYLKAAIAKYREMGGEYVPGEAEKKDAAFQADIRNIIRLSLRLTPAMFLSSATVVEIKGENGVISFYNPCFGAPDEEPTERKFIDAEEFFLAVETLHLGEWEENYEPDCIVMDGYSWELCIEYANGKAPAIWTGSNAYPYNFRELQNTLNEFLQYGEEE